MTRLLLSASLLFASCGAANASSDALTFATDTADGVVAMTYDGSTARVYTHGQLTSRFDAPSAEAALWGVVEPEITATSGARVYDRALSRAEIEGLTLCTWPPPGALLACGGIGCDCAETSAQ